MSAVYSEGATQGGQRAPNAHEGMTARQGPDMKILYDAPLAELTCGEKLSLFNLGCSYYDKERSYLYVRENGIEYNFAIKPCCGVCGSRDAITTQYFDRAPFAPKCHCLPGPYCFLMTSRIPRWEVVDPAMNCCCIKCDNECIFGPKRIKMVPFDECPFPLCCMSNRTKTSALSKCFGGMENQPKIAFSPGVFFPHPADTETFAAKVNLIMPQNPAN